MRHGPYPIDALKRRTLQWAVRLRVNPRVIRVQTLRRKWGSCSVKGTVTLAASLADMEPRFQDYVIVHELLHLRVPNHGRLFKALMTAYVPGWRTIDGLHQPRQRGRDRRGTGTGPAAST